MPITDAAYDTTHVLCHVRVGPSAYALAPICYTISGTDIAYGATRCSVLKVRMVLRARYAMHGTDTAYGATRS
eukprot:120072-Rhodomonas_salina.1